jgi:hypothetical protein
VFFPPDVAICPFPTSRGSLLADLQSATWQQPSSLPADLLLADSMALPARASVQSATSGEITSWMRVSGVPIHYSLFAIHFSLP